MKKFNLKKSWSMWLSLLGFFLVVILIGYGLNETSKETQREEMTILTKAINSATLQCYALEGVYPPDLEYLKLHYGLIVDDTKYIVHYENMGDNIMPDVTIIKKEEEQ